MTDIPNSRRSPMEHERDMPDAQIYTLTERMKSANVLRRMHNMQCFENGYHHSEVDTPYSIGSEAISSIDAAQAEIAKLRAALSELADLMDDVRTGEYAPDSFTTQPARAALAQDASE